MAITNSNRGISAALSKAGPVLIVAGILLGGWWIVSSLPSRTSEPEEVSVDTAQEFADTDLPVVVLPEGKVRAASFQSESVERRHVQHMHVVPGRIRYDEARHIDLKAPVGGILDDVLVKPGDRVEAGQLLAVINSAQVGEARANVLKLEADLRVSQRKLERQRSIAQNLAQLLQQLDQGRSIDELSREFSGKPIGDHRTNLISAYSRLLLADQLARQARPVAQSGAISGQTLQQHEAERRTAEAAFRAVREKAEFQSDQDQQVADNEASDAERRVRIAHQELQTLLGQSEPASIDDAQKPLSRLEIVAPFAGTIESRSFAKSERVELWDSLFVLADTSSMYVAADIRENDWPAVLLEPGQELVVSVPAVEGKTFPAFVHYVGREVDASSNSIPLVATVDNRIGSLRAGMFVRVEIPIGQPRDAIAVRPGAVMQHDNEQFVFVALNDNTFQRVGVVTGQATDHWVEILSGLEPGQQVVDEGAFLLKSELLLEGEDE